MYKIILAAAVLALSPSLADAGGNGKHSNGTVRFQNNDQTADAALVAVNPSASLRAATTLQEFTARGGRVVELNQNTDFTNIRSGRQTVLIVRVVNGQIVSTEERQINVSRGQTTTVSI